MKTIKELRLARNLTLVQVSERMNLKNKEATKKGYPSSIYRLEAGTQIPTIGRLEELLRAMDYGIEIYAVDGEERIPIKFTHPRAKDAQE